MGRSPWHWDHKPSLGTASQAQVHPPPGLVTCEAIHTSMPQPGSLKIQSIRMGRQNPRDMAHFQTSLLVDLGEVLVPGGDGREGAGVWSSDFILPSSQQMLGTIRINGLESQVRAIPKLLDYSPRTTLYGGKG